MSHELYKIMRPQELSEFLGNGATVASLKRFLEDGEIPHTILFHGPSGCGKTTLARILKDKLDCSDGDYTELNCSDQRGIDTIRQIARVMKYSPMGGATRIYVLDEAHQLTKDAQHAALKIFEDTPDHVYFILCTTEPKKLIKTIQNRCTDLEVRPLSRPDMQRLLIESAEGTKTHLPKETINKIYEHSEGSPRKALVILDRILGVPADEQPSLISWESPEEEAQIIEFCRLIVNNKIKGNLKWSKVQHVLKNLKADPESIRHAVLGYAKAVLLNNRSIEAYKVLCAFQDNFYDSKMSGVVRASYEVVFGDN